MAKPRPIDPSPPLAPITPSLSDPDPLPVPAAPLPDPVVAPAPAPAVAAPAPAQADPATPDADDDDDDAPAPLGIPLTGLVPAGYILGWVQHEIDSVPDQNGVSSKVRVHTLGLIPVPGQ